ncbi:MAG TPA: C40 family peptidase [Trebonia sp.]|nr:C40 family peptidase [Trebonia sp.]
MSSLIRLGAAALAVPAALVLGIALAAGATGVTTATSPPVSPACGTTPVQAGKSNNGTVLDSTQIADAEVIYSVSASLQLPQQAAVIAIATSMQESSLVNTKHGTSDSLGLFQQRPSQGWGTPAQIMDPVYASTRFYRALVQVADWQSLPLTVAAQDVQHSQHPGAYARWQQLAEDLVATFTGTAGDCATDNSTGVPASGTTRIPAGFSLPPGTPPQVVTAIAYALRQLGKPYVWGGDGPGGYDCSGLVMLAYEAAGISLPRTTFQQVDVGLPIYSLSQLQPGDLIFTAGSDGTVTDPGHVGMYIGDGLVVEAPETGKPIMITPLEGYWSTNVVAMRRIV